jgi:hypothetical protein
MPLAAGVARFAGEEVVRDVGPAVRLGAGGAKGGVIGFGPDACAGEGLGFRIRAWG